MINNGKPGLLKRKNFYGIGHVEYTYKKLPLKNGTKICHKRQILKRMHTRIFAKPLETLANTNMLIGYLA